MFALFSASSNAIASWLTSQGFSVTAVRRNRRDVEFAGTVAAPAAAPERAHLGFPKPARNLLVSLLGGSCCD